MEQNETDMDTLTRKQFRNLFSNAGFGICLSDFIFLQKTDPYFPEVAGKKKEDKFKNRVSVWEASHAKLYVDLLLEKEKLVWNEFHLELYSIREEIDQLHGDLLNNIHLRRMRLTANDRKKQDDDHYQRSLEQISAALKKSKKRIDKLEQIHNKTSAYLFYSCVFSEMHTQLEELFFHHFRVEQRLAEEIYFSTSGIDINHVQRTGIHDDSDGDNETFIYLNESREKLKNILPSFMAEINISRANIELLQKKLQNMNALIKLI